MRQKLLLADANFGIILVVVSGQQILKDYAATESHLPFWTQHLLLCVQTLMMALVFMVCGQLWETLTPKNAEEKSAYAQTKLNAYRARQEMGAARFLLHLLAIFEFFGILFVPIAYALNLALHSLSPQPKLPFFALFPAALVVYAGLAVAVWGWFLIRDYRFAPSGTRTLS